MDSFGFIITRHVNSAQTNRYWNQNVRLLRALYPLRKIVIIDDNSNAEYVCDDGAYDNVQVIHSTFAGRGELLPYYYLLKHKFFDNAVILHDGVFIHQRIQFEKLRGMPVLPLWSFNPDKENVGNTKRIVSHLRNSVGIQRMIANDEIALPLFADKWHGCFGVQSYINLSFLERLEQKYKITNLVHVVKCRADRCCLERIFGAIFCAEYPTLLKHNSLLGNIMTYQAWGYSYDEYTDDLQTGTIPRKVVKIWTGR